MYPLARKEESWNAQKAQITHGVRREPRLCPHALRLCAIDRPPPPPPPPLCVARRLLCWLWFDGASGLLIRLTFLLCFVFCNSIFGWLVCFSGMIGFAHRGRCKGGYFVYPTATISVVNACPCVVQLGGIIDAKEASLSLSAHPSRPHGDDVRSRK